MSTLTKNKKPNAFVRLTKHSEFTIGLVVIALFLLATFLTKNFFGSYNLKNLTKQGAIVGVLAVAQTFIIITSGIDISGGAIAGLGCMTMAMIMNGKGTSMLGIAILANFVVCTLCGFLNGVIIFDLKVPAMIATLGTQTIFRGILKLLCNGNSISFFEPDGATFVKLFDTIGNYDIFGVLPVLACIWIVVAVIAFLVLRYTVFGRDLFVIGSGIEVARLSGIKVRKTFYLVYSLAGFVYGIAAIMFAGRILRAMPNTGDGYDMDAIAAAVIGGASLAGGRGAITGTFVGTLLMVVIKNAGKAFQINDYILDVITGASDHLCRCNGHGQEPQEGVTSYPHSFSVPRFRPGGGKKKKYKKTLDKPCKIGYNHFAVSAAGHIWRHSSVGRAFGSYPECHLVRVQIAATKTARWSSG